MSEEQLSVQETPGENIGVIVVDSETHVESGVKESDQQTKGTLLTEENEVQKDAPKAPDKYELVRSEESLLSDETVEGLEKYARENGLSNEKAQELLDRQNQLLAEFSEKQKSEMEQEISAWVEEAKKDKEIGGDKFNESIEMAKRVVEKFGSDEFKKALNSSGIGNHPELIRTFARIGRMMADDSFVKPDSVSGSERTAEEIFYGKAS